MLKRKSELVSHLSQLVSSHKDMTPNQHYLVQESLFFFISTIWYKNLNMMPGTNLEFLKCQFWNNSWISSTVNTVSIVWAKSLHPTSHVRAINIIGQNG